MMQAIGAEHGDKSVTQVWRTKAAGDHVVLQDHACGTFMTVSLFCILFACFR
jgi:hypothetical protein